MTKVSKRVEIEVGVRGVLGSRAFIELKGPDGLVAVIQEFQKSFHCRYKYLRWGFLEAVGQISGRRLQALFKITRLEIDLR